MELTADEMETMNVGQIVIDNDGHEWQQDSAGRWEGGERGRMWAGALVRHWGPIRRKEWGRLEEEGRPGRESHVEQPMPTPSTGPSMHYLAADVLNERYNLGLDRYGRPLQAMNGRDAVRDTIEELADGLAYALQIREERRLLRADLERLAEPGRGIIGANELRGIIDRYFPKES